MIVVNKIDLLKKNEYLKKIEYIQKNLIQKKYVTISAIKSIGINSLLTVYRKNFTFFIKRFSEVKISSKYVRVY